MPGRTGLACIYGKLELTSAAGKLPESASRGAILAGKPI
jgi:hypothetical protein